ncbi:MAG: hypothetical protein ACT6XY_08305 [Phreatobacter sp.]|uniref:hypothetical protein n=1 Tax=Phreatobacter sp. TaxID=1966341 RepID=UPI0040359A12
MNGAEIALRLVGAFYVLAGLIAARQMVMEAFLDKALAGLTLKPVSRADRLRGRWMLGIAAGVFGGGVLLLALSILALPAFLACAAAQATYLGHAAPRLIDPEDPPDPAGRRRTRNAFLVYLCATGLVAAAAAEGHLRWPSDDPWPAAIAGIALAAFVAWHVSKASEPLGERRTLSTNALEPETPEVLPDKVRLMVRPFVLPFADDATGRVVPQSLAVTTFGEALVAEILDWEEAYLATIPPQKRTGGFTDPEAAARHEAEGRALAARMAAVLGAQRVTHAPVGTPFPEAPERSYTRPGRIKLMADYGCHPLWSMDEAYSGNIDPEVLGLSPALVADLMAWAERFDDALDWDNPGVVRDDDGFLARHEHEGRALASRLAGELAALGRDVQVYLRTQEHGVVEVTDGSSPPSPA